MKTNATQKDTTLEAASFYPDLLCELDGEKVRTKYEQGKDLNPIGFFPFSDEDVYLMFEHYPLRTYRYFRIEKKKSLSISFFDRLYAQKNKINEFLAHMNKPLLNKKFFAAGGTDQYIWIVDFSIDSDRMDRDYFYDNSKAIYVPWGKV